MIFDIYQNRPATVSAYYQICDNIMPAICCNTHEVMPSLTGDDNLACKGKGVSEKYLEEEEMPEMKRVYVEKGSTAYLKINGDSRITDLYDASRKIVEGGSLCEKKKEKVTYRTEGYHHLAVTAHRVMAAHGKTVSKKALCARIVAS